MAQQTAVEWLVKKLEINPGIRKWVADSIKQAKQMEKEQIMNAYSIAYQDGCNRKDDTSGNIYYNETYNK